MHHVHFGYTILARLKSGHADAASALLKQMHADPEQLPFGACATIHFASGAVIPDEQWGDDELPATLLIATSFSGPANVHVDELVRVCNAGLRALFAHCEDFPQDASDRELVRFIKDRRRADTFYSGMHGLTREDVLRHQALRGEIQTFLDARRGALPADPIAARIEIQEFVKGRPDLAWAQASCAEPPGAFWAQKWRSVVTELVVGTFLLALGAGTLSLLCCAPPAVGVAVALGWLTIVLLVVTVVGLLLGVRSAERHQTEVAIRPEDARVRELAATQNHPVINECTISGPIKNGAVRPLFLRILLWVVARAAEGIPLIKSLRTGIHIPTVATARWIAMDRGKRLVFLSNYTNAAEPYVRDFIDIRAGAQRINISFGFGGGYPKTDWIYQRGAVEDPNAFIWVVAQNQRKTELWFCPYDDMSIDNIVINRKIREGLFGPKSKVESETWLRLL